MVKKKYLSKLFLVGVMCMSLITPMLSSVSTYADTDSTGNVNSVGSEIGDTNESAVGKDITQGKQTEYQDGVTGTNHTEIYMTVASQFNVVIPKTVILDGVGKTGAYSIKLTGDIPGTAKITVVPDATSVLHSDGKDDIIAEISQVQTEWVNSTMSYVSTGTITANGATAGVWKGDLNFNIQYDGEGGGGDTHIHNWSESITKEATCTTTGIKTFTCSECGTTKTQTIPATGHNYVDGVCSNCGVEQICSHVDDNNDHLCDKCGQVISSHVDTDKDHNCDTCGVAMSEHTDADNDSVCDYCGTTLCDHVDANNDHNCDNCGKKLSECEDKDNNHNCDVCGTKLSEHVDTDNNHNCDLCGSKISEHVDADGDGVCDICNHSHTWVTSSVNAPTFSGGSVNKRGGSSSSTVSKTKASTNGGQYISVQQSGGNYSSDSTSACIDAYVTFSMNVEEAGDYTLVTSTDFYNGSASESYEYYDCYVVMKSPSGKSTTVQFKSMTCNGTVRKNESISNPYHLEKGVYTVTVNSKSQGLEGGHVNLNKFAFNPIEKTVCSGCGEVKSSN